ncbi:MAG TPA: hypothetical protein PKE30_16705 [Niabella sp.]|nr:hypothetical protein [Niabella sp.]
MKIIIVVIAICFSTALQAQNRPLLYIKPKAVYNDSISNSPGLLDTTHMYSSKYGKVARLTQDNMPCILPYNNTIEIPNATGRKQAPTEIPNAWKDGRYPSLTQPQKPVPHLAPHGKSNTPYLKTDSVKKK